MFIRGEVLLPVVFKHNTHLRNSMLKCNSGPEELLTGHSSCSSPQKVKSKECLVSEYSFVIKG